mgnify:FL=1
MDTISFRYTRWEYGADTYPLPAVEIFINGADFMEEIHEAEHIVCGEERGHAPLTPEELYDSLTEDYKEDNALIYGCTCGVAECDPVYVQIAVDGETVIWRDFTSRCCNPENPLPLRAFVFDRAAYFAATKRLRLWMSRDPLLFSYGGIAYGYLTLTIEKAGKTVDLVFDECLSDPMPDLVHFMNCTAEGTDIEIAAGNDYGDSPLTLVATGMYRDTVLLELRFSENDIVASILRRDEVVAMLRGIADALRTDACFPYMYPSCDDIDDDAFDRVLEVVEAQGKDLSEEEETILLAQGLCGEDTPLTAEGVTYLTKYLTMLDTYIVPAGWVSTIREKGCCTK